MTIGAKQNRTLDANFVKQKQGDEILRKKDKKSLII